MVEGPDDKHVFRHLFDHHGIPHLGFTTRHIPEGQIAIKDFEGVERLLESISEYLKGTEAERLGIVVDADTSIDRRWQSIRDILISHGCAAVPTTRGRSGIVVQHETKHAVGVWIMPDNLRNGMLEDFVKSLIPRGDRLWPRARRTVSLIQDADRRVPDR